MRTTNRLPVTLFLYLSVSLLLGLPSFAAAPDVEASVLAKVTSIYRQQGQINFSELYNSNRFSAEERNYLGRLYEVFFAIPEFLATEKRATGHPPTRSQIASSFGIGEKSVDLLLSVMSKDPRIPRMFSRDGENGEIETIDTAAIEAFVKARGANVRMTRWEGQPLPEFSLPRLGGGTLESRDLKGHPVVLYFWFSGCPPCVRIAPILADLSKKYGARGVKFVGMNADDVLEIGTSDGARQQYVEREGIQFPVVNLDEATRLAFGQVNVFPTLFFADGQGVIRHHLINFQDRQTLDSILQGMH